MTIGSGADRVDLQIGDVLVSFNQDETILGAYYETGVDTLVGRGDLLVFRPTTAGDFSAGRFYMLLNDIPDTVGVPITNLNAISLIEQDTVVGSTPLAAGTFIFSEQGGAAPNNIYHFTATSAGKSPAAGTTITLIDGADIGIGFPGHRVRGLDIAETATTIGGHSLAAGSILVTLDVDNPAVGANGLNTATNDIFVLNVTAAEPETGTTAATAEMFMDGSDVNLDGNERVYAIALVPENVRPEAQDDRVGLSFDGVDDFVLVANDPSLVMANNMTMEAWINHSGNGTGSQIILNKEGEYELGITADTGELKWAIADSGNSWFWRDLGVFVTPGEWNHIAVTYDGVAGEVRTYVNGMLVDTFSQSGAIGDAYAGFNEFRIGTRENANDQHFEGLIDEVRIWNVTRTEADIKINMDGLLTGAEPGLVGNWRLDEASGTTATDQSSSGNDGTLGGAIGPAAEPTWDGYSTNMNAVLNIPAGTGVLANDLDVDGDTLTATNLDTSSTLGLVTLNADGSFTYDPNGQFNFLLPGQIATDTFSYTANDGTGDSNVATVTITIIGVDVTAPIVTVNALTTNDSTPQLTGTVDDPLATIQVTVGGNSYAATNNGDGTWTLADDTIAPALADGTYDVAVTATDPSLNSGTDGSVNELVIDTAAPVVTVNSLTTNDTTPQLTGTVSDPAATIQVTVGGNTYAATNNGDGTWTLADNTIAPALADGTYDVAVTATDAATNAGTDGSVERARHRHRGADRHGQRADDERLRRRS